jgi:hypothetical protein
MGTVPRHFVSDVQDDLPLEYTRRLYRLEFFAAFFCTDSVHILCIDLQTERNLDNF